MAAGGFRYAPGSIVVPTVKGIEPVVAGIASELGLRVDGVRGRAPANTRRVGGARVALYKPWMENIDEGWTRWLLEKHQFPFTSLSDAQIRAGSLRAQYDAIILPSASAERLVAGHPPEAVPAEYAGGLGQPGVDALRSFVQEGGTLVCLDQSCELADHARSIWKCATWRARPATSSSAPARSFASSSTPRIHSPMGCPSGVPASSRSAPRTVHPAARRRWRSTAMKDLLVSGWIEGEEAIAGQSAVVEAKVGARTRRAARLPRPAPWSVARDVPAAVQRVVDDSWSGEAITTPPRTKIRDSFSTCTLCEAACGVAIEVDGKRVIVDPR